MVELQSFRRRTNRQHIDVKVLGCPSIGHLNAAQCNNGLVNVRYMLDDTNRNAFSW